MIISDLYLDIDGVMLHYDGKKYSVNQLILECVLKTRDKFDRVFWLSCWTKTGEVERLYFKYPELEEVGAVPLRWGLDKHEAIDFKRPYIWVEDGFCEIDKIMCTRKKTSEYQKLVSIDNLTRLLKDGEYEEVP